MPEDIIDGMKTEVRRFINSELPQKRALSAHLLFFGLLRAAGFCLTGHALEELTC
jgi:hypothetical protein